MVFKQPLRHWIWNKIIMRKLSLSALLFCLCSEMTFANQLLGDAESFYRAGHYFKAARYAFAAQESNSELEGKAYSWVTLGLAKSGLYQAASYFFIRTLQTGDKTAIRRVLFLTEELLTRVGADVLRKYLIRHTQYEDYDLSNRSAYLYALARQGVLQGESERAIGYVGGMDSKSSLWPFALQLRGSAFALLGKNEEALKDFDSCKRESRNNEDLRARCEAGLARVYYQMNRFEEAEQAYEQISKRNIIWPDLLFERAWNAFSKEEYNRALGRLVSYKSPSLQFVYNTEVDVLRAQSYLALCLYADANETVNEFNDKYVKLGEEVKKFVEKNSNNLFAFYDVGKKALGVQLNSKNGMNPMLNRFVRGPYFKNLILTEGLLDSERIAIKRFASLQDRSGGSVGSGFPGFLELVLKWRTKSVYLLGGAFVKNSLIDYHSTLISDFEKIAFIKLEMLSRAKHRLVYKKSTEAERSRGNVIPLRRDDQYYWSFNGEFWDDELGDYIFGLESECGSNG